MNLKVSNLARVLALVLFGLLASACNMNVQDFLEARQGSSAGGNVMISGPRAQFIYSHADW